MSGSLLKSTIPIALLISMNAAGAWESSPEIEPLPKTVRFLTIDSRQMQELTTDEVAFSQEIPFSDASWVRLHFKEWSLGEEAELIIRALKDNARQRFTSQTLRRHQGWSAYFNGDAVEISIFNKAGEVIGTDGLYFIVDKAVTGESVGSESTLGFNPESQCGPTDDRVPIDDDRVARVITVGGTAWLGSNGAILTAGHVLDFMDNTIIEFNVPASNADGSINHPHPDHQFTIDPNNRTFVFNGLGDDYAVFNVIPNANTGLLPIEAYGVYFRMSRDVAADPTIRITGYGDDQGEANRTEQTHTGPFLREYGNVLEYQVDTYNGNSGSPVQRDGTDLAYGIHTNAGCSDTHGNTGTSFENDGLEALVHSFPARFPGQNIVYLDNNHTGSAAEDGTVFRPYDTFAEAANNVSAGGLIHPVEGEYMAAGLFSGEFHVVAPATGDLVLVSN